jgi:hypothetical protein
MSFAGLRELIVDLEPVKVAISQAYKEHSAPTNEEILERNKLLKVQLQEQANV